MTGLHALIGQLDVTWRFAQEALSDLTADEVLWVPTEGGWSVHQTADGRWVPDWEEPEPEVVPSTSIAWIQWHVVWWWSTMINHSFGDGRLNRQDVQWPGPEKSMIVIDRLRSDWLQLLSGLDDTELASGHLTKWPYDDGRPFLDVVAWANIELMKNVAEMAMVRRITPHYGRT